MSVPVKPTENTEWAEGGGALVNEPTGERAKGFPFGYVLTAAQFNWLVRTLGRLARYAAEKADLHVHDGGSDPGSVAKIDLKAHVDWGDNGFLEVTEDEVGPGGHTITHDAPGGTSAFRKFITGILQASTHVITGGIRTSPGGGNLDIRAEEGGSTTVAITGSLTASGTVSASVLSSSYAIRARCRVDGSSRAAATPLTYINSVGIDETEEQTASTGVYNIRLSTPAANANAISVHPSLGEAGMIHATVTSASIVQVRTFDTSGSAADKNFSLQIYY
ncbi:MAG: hypothetical protein ACNA8W_02380 [Bradymonadaceae bacterium]